MRCSGSDSAAEPVRSGRSVARRHQGALTRPEAALTASPPLPPLPRDTAESLVSPSRTEESTEQLEIWHSNRVTPTLPRARFSMLAAATQGGRQDTLELNGLGPMQGKAADWQQGEIRTQTRLLRGKQSQSEAREFRGLLRMATACAVRGSAQAPLLPSGLLVSCSTFSLPNLLTDPKHGPSRIPAGRGHTSPTRAALPQSTTAEGPRLSERPPGPSENITERGKPPSLCPVRQDVEDGSFEDWKSYRRGWQK